MDTIEKTMDTAWTLDDQNRVLSRGGRRFHYSSISKADAAGRKLPIKWEEELSTGEFGDVTDRYLIEQLNSALTIRLAMLDGGSNLPVRHSARNTKEPMRRKN
jgi:hypothetical protein